MHRPGVRSMDGINTIYIVRRISLEVERARISLFIKILHLLYNLSYSVPGLHFLLASHFC
jgi:hypothetical protein